MASALKGTDEEKKLDTLLSTESPGDFTDALNSNFLDPGVSNGDVDWLFRGREVKKLTKRSNTINNEVQSQLLHAQQKALAQSKNGRDSPTSSSSTSLQNLANSAVSVDQQPLSNSSSGGGAGGASTSGFSGTSANSSQYLVTQPKSAPVAIPIPSTRKSSNSSNLNLNSAVSTNSLSDLPIKSSLKSSSPANIANGLKIDTSMTYCSNSPSNNDASVPLAFSASSSSHRSLSSPMDSAVLASASVSASASNPASAFNSSSNPNSTSTPTTPTNRSRSSSLLFGRSKSPSNASEHKPAKKSLLSSLSSKLKPGSHSASAASSTNTSPSSAAASKASAPSSPSLSRNTIPVAPSPVRISPPIHNNGSDNSLTKLAHAHNYENTHSNASLSGSDKLLDSVSFSRVSFALDGLVEDPQQQIPSRRPKRGNVLIPEDMLAPPPKLSIGITNSFNEQTKDEKPKVDPKLYEQALARQNFFTAESKKHSEEAHIAALRMAKEVSSFKKRRSSFLKSDDDDDDDDEEDITDSRFVSGDDKLDIDTPLHEHVDYFGHEEHNSSSSSTDEEADRDISLETLYTRCCHLREILPIPATLKQLKGKSKPLHVLKMLNPKPTLIDILSFSDFLAIAPVISVILDNVTVDTEMLRIILISLKNSKMLDKLSLRNVPIDAEGWKYLCKFLRLNTNIQKLDISQQRVKKSSAHSKTIRSELDWDLFTDTLILRGGIEELVIHGCCLSTDQLNNLVNKALILKTKRLGFASAQLDVEKMSILAKWISAPSTTCNGIDFAFNDLSQGQLVPINNVLKQRSSDIKLQFFSLNSTNVQLKECSELIKNLSALPSLRFLDLSNNAHLFPDIIPVLRDYLPKYPDLRRLHFDFDNLTEFAIVQLCVIFQQCPRLVHVSFLGNNKITSKSASALYSAVKHSHIYNIDMDYDGLDEELVSRIAFYLMRNMETLLNFSVNPNGADIKTSSAKSVVDSESNTITAGVTAKDEDLIFDGSLLTKAAEHLLENGSHISGEERMVIYRALVEKTVKLRTEIHDAMNKLFEAREKGKLSIEGKENLLRFCLLDDSLENILDIFSDEVSTESGSSGGQTNSSDHNGDHVSSRPGMIKKLSSQLTRHHSSEDVIQTGPIVSGKFYQHNDEIIPTVATEAPHIVVADADSVPVDSTTGKRVLMRKFSQTSVHSKKLEEEEGELHRWGFFVQQQNDIMPDDSQNVAKMKEEEKERERLRIEAEKAEKERLKSEAEKKKLKINTIPSGSELRETIMKAKGIESITDLIKKVNKDFTTVETIYKHADAKRAASRSIDASSSGDSYISPSDKSGLGSGNTQSTKSSDISKTSLADADTSAADSKTIPGEDRVSNRASSPDIDASAADNTLSPTVSISSINEGDIKDQADEVYERILNNVIRVRSNK